MDLDPTLYAGIIVWKVQCISRKFHLPSLGGDPPPHAWGGDVVLVVVSTSCGLAPCLELTVPKGDPRSKQSHSWSHTLENQILRSGREVGVEFLNGKCH